MIKGFKDVAVWLGAAILAGAALVGPVTADDAKPTQHSKQRHAKKKAYVRPSGENWFTCRYNCGDPLRREGLDWWQSRAEQRDGGNTRRGK